jgi:aspartyl-tRNA(Asn)/glutamyl-tRNA(Gln) amidotransferase subunit B
VTVSQRTKEEAHDYRYFPEPDLPPLAISGDLVSAVRARLPELPLARRARLIEAYGISRSDAAVLTAEREIADVFEDVVAGEETSDRARLAASWIVNDLIGLQRERGFPPERVPLDIEQIRDLLDSVSSGELTARAAKELLPQVREGELPRAAAKRLNLLVLTDDAAIANAIRETLAESPQAVADYKSGKKAAIGRLIGETIRRTGGRARPDDVRARLERALDELP